MKIWNETKKTIVIHGYITTDRNYSFQQTTPLHHKKGRTVDWKYPKLQMVIYEHKAELSGIRPTFTEKLWDTGLNFVKTVPGPGMCRFEYSNTDEIVVTHHPKQRVVDMVAVKQSYLDNIEELGGSAKKDVDVAAISAQTASVVLSSVGTSIAMVGTGAGAATGVGVLVGVAGLLLVVLAATTAKPPAPPSSAEIEAIVEKVVARELDKNDATKAATGFAIGLEELLRYAALAHDHFTNSGELTESLQDRVLEAITHNLQNHGEGTFRYSIEHMARNPEIAMWIIPSYVEGISAWITFNYLDLLAHHPLKDDGTLPELTLDQKKMLRKEIIEQRDALKNALAHYDKKERQALEESGLHDTGFEAQMKRLHRRSVWGTGDFSPISACLESLEAQRKELQSQIFEEEGFDPKSLAESLWKSAGG